MRSRRNVVDAPRQRAGRCAESSITLVTMLTRRSTRRWFSPFFCATVSVALGAAYMRAAGAPSYYLLVNFSALAAGLLAASFVRSALVFDQRVGGTFRARCAVRPGHSCGVNHSADSGDCRRRHRDGGRRGICRVWNDVARADCIRTRR